MAGIIKTKSETLVAEKPNPANPLIVDANNIIKQIRTKFIKVNSR